MQLADFLLVKAKREDVWFQMLPKHANGHLVCILSRFALDADKHEMT